MTSRHRPRMRERDELVTATPLELFFDLVFVFALTQVTAAMAKDHSVHGLVRGLLVLGLLWWSWIAYAWLCNVVKIDTGWGRLALFGAMAAMFVLAVTIPEAYDDLPGGLNGPVVVALCYFAFRLLHLTLFWLSAADDAALRRQILRFTPSFIGGTALLLAASEFHGTAQTLLWGGALTADYLGTYMAGASGWRVLSPSHFAERHGLILIVALGESIVAIGVGVASEPTSWPIVVASILGLAVAGALWWTYFDNSAPAGEHLLSTVPESGRAKVAQEAYTYLHMPMIVGIVFLALGLKKVLEYVGDSQHHSLTDALNPYAVFALFGGVVLYLLAQAAFGWRVTHKAQWARLATSLVLVAGGIVATVIPALAALALIAVATIALVTVETLRTNSE